MVDQVVVGGEHAVRQPVVAHELPHVFLRVQLRALWRQRHDGDVVRHDQVGRHVPSGPVEQQCGVAAGFDLVRDRRQVPGHGVGVAPGHDESRALALLGADGAEDVGRCRALVLRCTGPGAALGPAPGQLVLLADARFIAEPDF